MVHRADQKEASRARILESAGRGFRSHGFGGLGVDGLAKEAGVTSGAFYAHFKSKADAFREAVAAGMEQLANSIGRRRESDGEDWRTNFIDYYTSNRRTVDLAESCALQSLTGEVARADAGAKEAYEAAFLKIIDAAAAGFDDPEQEERRSKAVALLALLTGGVSLARAVKDPALSEEIAEAVKQAALRLV